jgi:molybdate transport system substrate-binding protein
MVLAHMRRLRATLLVFITVAASVPSHAASARDVMVFAAATLQDALDEATTRFQAEAHIGVPVSYGPSAALVKQIANGAPADIFISADADWMNEAEHEGLLYPASRFDLLSSRLVLIAARDSEAAVEIKPGFDLAALLGSGRLAMCDPMMMPAGRYGRAALLSLGVWDSVKDRVAQAATVRAAMIYVSRGEAPLGIVFDTDAVADTSVKIIGTFPRDSHPAIVYPVALTVAGGANPDAARFLAFLKSPAAKSIFASHGYSFLP